LPLVSIITPCYEHGHFLADAVDSVLAQTHRDFELIIINDGSTDETGPIARRYVERHPERIIYLDQANQGQSKARQDGLERATGKWLVLLDADDLLEPTMLERCLEAARRRPEPDAIVANAALVGPDGMTVLRPFPQDRLLGWPAILDHNPYGALAAVMVRRAAVREVGGLAVEGTGLCEDWDLWVRMTRCGMRFVSIGDSLSRYRQTPQSHSRKVILMLESYLQLLERCRVEDPRLPRFGWRVVSPIGEREVRRFRNMRVFHCLGLAMACGPSATDVSELLDRLLPGWLQPRRCWDQALGGLHFGLQSHGGLAVTLNSPLTEIMRKFEEGLEAKGFGRHRKRLAREFRNALNDPFRPRSLPTRVRQRLGEWRGS